MSGGSGGAKDCTLVLDQDQARVRKRHAPPARPMQDRRRKPPRRKPDPLDELPAPGRAED